MGEEEGLGTRVCNSYLVKRDGHLQVSIGQQSSIGMESITQCLGGTILLATPPIVQCHASLPVAVVVVTASLHPLRGRGPHGKDAHCVRRNLRASGCG